MHVARLLYHSSKAMPACSITAACTCEDKSLWTGKRAQIIHLLIEVAA